MGLYQFNLISAFSLVYIRDSKISNRELTMTASYKELLAQREALEQAIAQARQNEISSALTKVRELVAEYGLTSQDIFPSRSSKGSGTKAVSKVAAKYRDAATGQTWTGRGKAPKWIDGKDRAAFLIG
jgi:DNA-binding protein H-NS